MQAFAPMVALHRHQGVQPCAVCRMTAISRLPEWPAKVAGHLWPEVWFAQDTDRFVR